MDTTVVSTGPRLAIGLDGRLEIETTSGPRPVVVRRCFPWSDPGRHISLRDEDEEEIALVDDPARLDPASREAIERALAEAGFVLEVTRLFSVDEEVEIRHWKVETKHGPRSFQTRLDDWPRVLPGGGILIRDVGGDLYHVRAARELEAQSQRLLWAFVD